MLEKQLVKTWKAVKDNFFFQQDDHHGFLEDSEVRLVDKTQASDPTQRLLDEDPSNFVS